MIVSRSRIEVEAKKMRLRVASHTTTALIVTVLNGKGHFG